MTTKVQIAPGPEHGERSSLLRRGSGGSIGGVAGGSLDKRLSIRGSLTNGSLMKRSSVGSSRSSIISKDGKRRKPRRQSGAAVQFESKDAVVEHTRIERSDSDKVIRRASMERKMSQRNSVRLPEDFLKGLKGLDDSLQDMMNDSSLRCGMDDSSQRRNSGMDDSLHRRSSGMDDSSRRNQHREFSEAEIMEMSKAALQLSDSESELSLDLEEDIGEVI